ncbi:MAG TPA: hypothetical protein EYF98_15025 [Planctomycetes bacterium]|nr:hypothetical protein [Planctomycetota bacterium]
MADTAKNLIQKNGRLIKVQTDTTTLGNSDKPWGDSTDTISSTYQTTYGVFVDENARDLQARLSAVSRLVLSPVETDSVVVYIAAKGITKPSIQNKIVDGDKTWEIKQVMDIRPGNEAYLYILKVGN